MNILMLGDTAVGKTTLMVSAYGMMYENNVQGFYIKCKNEDVHNDLMRLYRAFCRDGTYPPGTARMKSYHYDFYSDRELVISFTLTDIRGESIRDYDTSELRKKIQESDVIMLFFNGAEVSQANKDDFLKEEFEETLLDLMPLLNNSFTIDGRERMLMAVFTQMDRAENIPDAIQSVRKFCKGMSEMARKNDLLSFDFAPTACSPSCMMNLDYTMLSLIRFGYHVEIDKRYQAMTKELEDTNRQLNNGFIESVFRDRRSIFPKKSGNGALNEAKRTSRKDALKRKYELSESLEYYYGTMLPRIRDMEAFLQHYDLCSSRSVKGAADPFSL